MLILKNPHVGANHPHRIDESQDAEDGGKGVKITGAGAIKRASGKECCR